MDSQDRLAAYRKAEWRRRRPIHLIDKDNERNKEYQKTFRGRMAQMAGRSNTGAKHRGAVGRVTGRDIIAIWLRQGGVLNGYTLCAKCGGVLEYSETVWIDHALPIAAGGVHERENLQLLCTECNKKKTGNDKRQMSARGSKRFDAPPEPVREQLVLFDNPAQ